MDAKFNETVAPEQRLTLVSVLGSRDSLAYVRKPFLIALFYYFITLLVGLVVVTWR